MKKIIVLTLSFVLVAVSAMAANTAASATGTTNVENITLQADSPSKTPIAKASKNVVFGWNTTATGYTLATFHTSGGKSYGTGYDATRIYFKDATAVAAPGSSTAGVAFTEAAGWKVL
jgi:hypothetical protein